MDIIVSTRQLNAQSMHRLLLSFLLFLLVHPFQAQGVTIGNPNPPHPSVVAAEAIPLVASPMDKAKMG